MARTVTKDDFTRLQEQFEQSNIEGKTFQNELATFLTNYEQSNYAETIKTEFLQRAKGEHLLIQLSPSDQLLLQSALPAIEAHGGAALVSALKEYFPDGETIEPEDPEDYYTKHREEIDRLKNEYKNFAKPKNAQQAATKMGLKGKLKSDFLETVSQLKDSFLKNGVNRGIIVLHEIKATLARQEAGSSRSRGTFRGSARRRVRKRSKSNRGKSNHTRGRKSMRRRRV